MLAAHRRDAGAVLTLDPARPASTGSSAPTASGSTHPVAPDVDICVALGGDGTILRALRTYAGTGVPVFGSTSARSGSSRPSTPTPLRGLPARPRGRLRGAVAARDQRLGRRRASGSRSTTSRSTASRLRVADLAYGVGAEEVGSVRCDGLVVATPAGSTGYNLANGGPVMAWGVEGFAVSFIAPHSLTARALVMSPTDVLTVHNRSREEPVDVTVDGRPVGALAPGEQVAARFVDDQGALAQVPGASFYHRLREKFGRLAAAT